MTLIPTPALIHEALAFADGAAKYDPYNWREEGVGARTYLGAAIRHIRAYLDGEQHADDSKVHHLGHARACLAIILDAEAVENLVDDRPLPAPTSLMMSNVKEGLPVSSPGYVREMRDILFEHETGWAITTHNDDLYERGIGRVVDHAVLGYSGLIFPGSFVEHVVPTYTLVPCEKPANLRNPFPSGEGWSCDALGCMRPADYRYDLSQGTVRTCAECPSPTQEPGLYSVMGASPFASGTPNPNGGCA